MPKRRPTKDEAPSAEREVSTGASGEVRVEAEPTPPADYGVYKVRETTDLIVIHCSATPASMDIGFAEIDQWHKDRGWLGCGYHRIIRRDGTVEEGRPLAVIGAHTYGYNRVSLGVCLVGGMDGVGNTTNNFMSPQLHALKAVLAELAEAYPEAKVVGHRSLSSDTDLDGEVEEHEWVTNCPGFEVSEMLGTLDKLKPIT